MSNWNFGRNIPEANEFFQRKTSDMKIRYDLCEKHIKDSMETVTERQKFIIKPNLVLNDNVIILSLEEKNYIIKILTRKNYICFDDGEEGITVRKVPKIFKDIRFSSFTQQIMNPFNFGTGFGTGFGPGNKNWWNVERERFTTIKPENFGDFGRDFGKTK